MDRSLLVRDRKLVFSGNFLGRVGVFSGGMEAEGVCLIMGLGGGPRLET
ncbi:hypothetical protein A2U01_0031051 [Trifolium medium]|uniref:Uncharacterized protein n=1 Tax=Trifolium medium TaxID=97028 RepID=A0A392PER2_9FABA|nr:hypothetical protein [Trifolium medium]